MEFRDTLTLDGPRITGDGYLVASVRAARTGIQNYTGREVDPENKHGLRDRAIVRVLRPAEEVFHKDTMASFTSLPITDDHPTEMVTADNWKKYATGNTGEDVARDGESMRVSLIVKDAAAIRKVEAGKRELSCGYTCDVAFTPGVTKDGLEYDAIQHNIRGNHLAIVGVARGGSSLRIGDSEVTLKTITIDGHSVEMSDAAAILVGNLQSKIATMQTTIDGIAAKDTQIATLTTQVSTKDAEIATLTQKVKDAEITPAKLRDAAKSYSSTVALAKAIAPTVTVTDAMDEAAIKKAVVSAKLGDSAKDWTDAQFETSFATLTAGVKTADTVRDSFMSQPTTQANMTDGNQKVADAQAGMIAYLTNGGVEPTKAA